MTKRTRNSVPKSTTIPFASLGKASLAIAFIRILYALTASSSPSVVDWRAVLLYCFAGPTTWVRDERWEESLLIGCNLLDKLEVAKPVAPCRKNRIDNNPKSSCILSTI